jgi:hypothetical protein
MPCPPGFVPVANVDHATGVCAGRVVATRANPPCSRSRARWGSWSCSSNRETMPGSRPSRPMTMTFLMIATFLLSLLTMGSAALAVRSKTRHGARFALENQAPSLKGQAVRHLVREHLLWDRGRPRRTTLPPNKSTFRPRKRTMPEVSSRASTCKCAWAAIIAHNPMIRLGGGEAVWVGRVVRLANVIRKSADRRRKELEVFVTCGSDEMNEQGRRGEAT